MTETHTCSVFSTPTLQKLSVSATTGVPAFSTGSLNSGIPFTSGQPEPTITINLTNNGPGPASTGATSTSSAGSIPKMTGAVGYGALFGAGAAALLGV
jgi:hypothetical protein